jgi:hypothetical protein
MSPFAPSPEPFPEPLPVPWFFTVVGARTMSIGSIVFDVTVTSFLLSR